MSLINVQDIFCDTKCLQNKEMKELYDNYEFVKQQLQNEVNSSKNYYNITPERDINKSALINSEKTKKIMDTFNISIRNIQSKIESYKNNIDNSNKDADLYELYYDKNNELLSEFNDNNTKTLTNDRNSYYENESSSSKSYYNNILKYSYILTLIIFLLFLYLAKSRLSTQTVILLLVLFIIFPIIFYNIFKFLHSVFLN